MSLIFTRFNIMVFSDTSFIVYPLQKQYNKYSEKHEHDKSRYFHTAQNVIFYLHILYMLYMSFLITFTLRRLEWLLHNTWSKLPYILHAFQTLGIKTGASEANSFAERMASIVGETLHVKTRRM